MDCKKDGTSKDDSSEERLHAADTSTIPDHPARNSPMDSKTLVWNQCHCDAPMEANNVVRSILKMGAHDAFGDPC